MRSKQHRSTRLSFETLERRAMLSASPADTDWLVNDYISGSQNTANSATAVALSTQGGIVVFEGAGATDRDGVYGRLLSATGEPVGASFLINQTTRGLQSNASVAMHADGRFAVVWEGRGVGDQDGVFLRLYAANGTPLSQEILLNQTIAGKQSNPVVGIAGDGTVVVAWQGSGNADNSGVYYRRLNFTGEVLGNEILANSASPGHQFDPALAVQSDGSFLISWTSQGQDGSDHAIVARRFNPSGQAQGEEFIVNSQHQGDQVTSAVAALNDGAYQIVWSSFAESTSGWDLRQTRILASGEVEAEKAVHTQAAGHQTSPSIASLGSDGFIISWTHAASDGHGEEVYARVFSALGNAQDSEFLALATQGFASGNQSAASVAALGDQIAIAWSGQGAEDRAGVYLSQLQEGVTQPNRPPQIDAISEKSISEGSELTFTVTATDPDGDSLTFSLDQDDAPAGATIDPQTGVFRWTPTEAQGPGTYTFRVLVTDSGMPALADSAIVTITVLEVNLPPDLVKPEDVEVRVGEEVVFTAIATDEDLPANKLTFSLDPDVTQQLPGASINADTGEFRWYVPEDFAPGRYRVRLLVIDDGTPALADSEFFWITVLGLEENSLN